MSFSDIITKVNKKDYFDKLLHIMVDKKTARTYVEWENDLNILEKGIKSHPEIFNSRRPHKRKNRKEEVESMRTVLENVKKLRGDKFKTGEKIYLNRLMPKNSISVEDYENRNGGKKPNIYRNQGLKNSLRESLLNLNAEWVDTSNNKKPKHIFNSVDLFSGAGGISCGFEMAGIKSILGIEIDPIASETFRNNFPDAIQYCGDITKLPTKEIQKMVKGKTVHIVTGGFPCQGFSVAGFRDPDDKRNVLYKEVVRTVRALKPWIVVLENVPGILTMKKGKVYKTIIEDFKSIGYPNMSVHLLEAADYGVAQLRPRAIFIANRFEKKNPYPKPQLKPEEYVPIEVAIGDLKDKSPDPLINHEWTRHSKKMIERIKKIKPGGSLYETFLDAYKRQYKGYPAMTIKENHGGSHVHYELNRCISAREMARLQSFPDNFIFAGSMKKAMWQIGNAVAPVMFKNIAKALIPKLEEIHEEINQK